MLPRACRFLFIFVAIFATSSSLAQNKNLKANLKEIDEYATKAGQDWRVPGFAMAIVKDDSVTKFLPWFQVYDPWVTREMMVRDLLCHHSGLATFGGDLEHWHFDTFRLKWRDSVVYPFPKGFVTFMLDAHGKVAEMKIEVPNPDFDFTELEFKRKSEPENN